jgi:hypothetical protein
MTPSPETKPDAPRMTLTQLAAAKFVESHGGDALGILADRAATAAERGHSIAAKTWRSMADTAARLLQEEAAGQCCGLGG